MKRNIIGNRLLYGEDLLDLEGKVKDATPVGPPKVYVVYQANALGAGNSRLRENKGAIYLHESDGIKLVSDDYIDDKARYDAMHILENEIRLAWNVPEEANAFNARDLKVVILPSGIIFSTAIQYYRIQ